MKEAKKFLKAKGLKDTLYNVNYNPNQNRGLPQKEWIKNGLSALLDEYADSKVKKLNIPAVSGRATDFEVELYRLINQYVDAGLKKPDLIHKMEYATQSCRVS